VTALPEITALAAALVIALIHVSAPVLGRLAGAPRSAWLSAFGGVSVAYVFVHLIPELAAWQARVDQRLADAALLGSARFAERHLYLVALLGLAAFYGLERLAIAVGGHRRSGEATEPNPPARRAFFWIHLGSFGAFNALVGYLLVHHAGPHPLALVAFAVAMALHAVVADHALVQHHRERYARAGRWLLAASVLGGYAAGQVGKLPELATGVLLGFLAGGVILNALKEELPAERQSRFWAFALGLIGSAVLLLVVPAG
jgi:uncharacterized membrane protein